MEERTISPRIITATDLKGRAILTKEGYSVASPDDIRQAGLNLINSRLKEAGYTPEVKEDVEVDPSMAGAIIIQADRLRRSQVIGRKE
jgi:hypothetical protein